MSRVFVDIPEPTWQSIVGGWDWSLNQGVRLLGRHIKDDWFDLYIDYVQVGLTYGLVHEFQTFRAFGIDTIVDFVEMVLESDGGDWNDAIATLVHGDTPLGRFIEEAEDSDTYFDVMVDALEHTMLPDDVLEILCDSLYPKLSAAGVEMDRIKSLRIDPRNHMFVIAYT